MNLNDDYVKAVEIDESALDVEWLSQPRLMLEYATLAARLKHDLNLAKEKLDSTRAILDTRIRSKPEEFGSSKITEKVVENTILIQYGI